MSITVQVKCGREVEVSVDPEKTVADFKDEIAKVSEIPAANQRLIYSGKFKGRPKCRELQDTGWACDSFGEIRWKRW